MNLRQQILRCIYPLLKHLSAWLGINNKIIKGNKKPLSSFYDLQATLIDGTVVRFDAFRNKKVLIVNTASYCGYTSQLEGLTQLQKTFPSVEILAFPSNDFRHQEPGSNEEIFKFCRLQFGVTYKLFQKVVVIRSEEQYPVYHWLSDPNLNGWNSQEPKWNFTKYLINESGELTYFIEHAVDPMDKRIQKILLD